MTPTSRHCGLTIPRCRVPTGLGVVAHQSRAVPPSVGADASPAAGGSTRARGSHNVNVEPRPTTLRTRRSPRIPRARSRLMASPSPVPSVVRVSLRCTWTKGSKIDSCFRRETTANACKETRTSLFYPPLARSVA